MKNSKKETSRSTKTTSMSKSVMKVVSKIDRKQLQTNCQRVLFTLLNSNGWVSRTDLKVPSATSRVRELRMTGRGGFKINCATAREINKTTKNPRSTFYSIDPSSVSMKKIQRAFKGVVVQS